jgi:hypothetical protein
MRVTHWNDSLSVVETKFCAPHWILMREFRDGTGFNSGRSADALAVGLYASRGQFIIGFEQKESRPDWLRELRNADKAEDICKFCDYWNVVIPDRAIVQLDELPQTWGLILVEGKRLKTIKAAPRLKCRPVSRNFMAAIIKRAVDDALRPHLTTDIAKHDESEREGYERGKAAATHDLEKYQALQAQVREFEHASGLHIAPYANMRKLGDAVRVVMNGSEPALDVRLKMQYALGQLKSMTEVFERQLDALDAMKNYKPEENTNGDEPRDADQEPGEAAGSRDA